MNNDLLLFLFFLLGVFSLGGVLLVFKMKKKNTITVPAWILISLGLLLLVFSIAWGISSIIEYETQAAGMGLLIFGGLALICFSIAVRLVKSANSVMKD